MNDDTLSTLPSEGAAVAVSGDAAQARPWHDFGALLFDLDGVVTDTDALQVLTWRRLFDEVLPELDGAASEPFVADEDYPAYIEGRPRTDAIRAFLASRSLELATGAPDDPPHVLTVHGLAGRKDQHFTAALAERGIEVYPDAIALLDAARGAGLHTAVVSASRNARHVLAAAGLLDRFDAVITAVEAEERGLRGRPAPDMFLAAARDVDVPPEEAIVFDDGVAGVRAGRAGRFGLVVGVDRRESGEGLAENGAHVVVSDLRALLDGREPLVTPDEVRPFLPWVEPDPRWTVRVRGDELAQRRPFQSILTVGDSRFGTRGVREEDAHGEIPHVLSAGIFDESADPPTLLEGSSWTGLQLLQRLDHDADVRTLDLRAGVLYREAPGTPVPLRTIRFATLARPGGAVLVAEGDVEWLHPGPPLLLPPIDGIFERRQRGHTSTARVTAVEGGSITAAATQTERTVGAKRVVERIVQYRADTAGRDRTDDALAGLLELEAVGVDELLAEQREAWARRWEDAHVEIERDPDIELGVRFGLFHLMAATPTEGEAAVGARGLSGPAYRGHVFWDTDVFILPFFAATCPAAARAILEYRIRRLGAAYEAAAERGLRGARFPWESASTGRDVTPKEDRPLFGPVIPILTGELEEHIVADVAWAAIQYTAWTGDEDFLRGPGRPLVLDTARYWASRVEIDEAGRGHIRHVIGPDEYHEDVDDNAFTNVIARWNLRRAAELAEAEGDVPGGEIAHWREVADALVDNVDPQTGLYEQFAGFFSLDDVVLSAIATPPLAADLILGRPFVHRSTIIKQADVLMLHHLVPEEVVPGSLEVNLDYYSPRTSHGSSLSPAVHASLLARAGRLEEAVELFRMACRLDLDDLTNTTARGLHMATFGGVWQALVHGFLGMRPTPAGLTIDPRIPPEWGRVRVNLRFRDRRVHVTATPDRFEVAVDGRVPLVVDGAVVEAEGTRAWSRVDDRWRAE